MAYVGRWRWSGCRGAHAQQVVHGLHPHLRPQSRPQSPEQKRRMDRRERGEESWPGRLSQEINIAECSVTEATYRVAVAADDAHHTGKSLTAERASTRLGPQHSCAIHTKARMTALQEDGIGWPLQANHAIIDVLWHDLFLHGTRTVDAVNRSESGRSNITSVASN